MPSTPQFGSRHDAQAVGASPAQGRIEPHLDDTPILFAAGQFQGEPEWKSSDNQASSGIRTYRLSRMAWMAGVFVMGAALGLAAAWWLKKPVPTIIVSPLERHGTAAGAAPETAQTTHPVTVRGIDADELPYDGAPPTNAGGQAHDRAAAVPVLDKSMNSALPSESDAAPAKPAAKAAELSPRPDDGKAAKTTPRRVTAATPRRSTKNKEIERIKQQAADELKKLND